MRSNGRQVPYTCAYFFKQLETGTLHIPPQPFKSPDMADTVHPFWGADVALYLLDSFYCLADISTGWQTFNAWLPLTMTNYIDNSNVPT
jgi:hypothetical protein